MAKVNEDIPMKSVVDKVKKMANYGNSANKMAKNMGLVVNTVSWEDCARNKGSVWGPCISDMTLQVGNDRMPVIRQPNYSDKTWDVAMDKIPVMVGNQDSNPGALLTTISLKQYLTNFTDYMSSPTAMPLDLTIANKDTHVIMSSQCCFLPIEKGKETKFNVALYNYQSKKQDPAVLVIVSTSKGTSAQIIEGNEQKLLFNNNGMKADFLAQRLTDNRIERNVNIKGAMTQEEKQDNVIVIIQVPLKQKPVVKHVHHFNQIEYDDDDMLFGGGGGGYPQAQNECMDMMFDSSFSSNKKNKTKTKKKKKRNKQQTEESKADVEAAIVKIAPKTTPMCKCGSELKKYQCQYAYEGGSSISCDACGVEVKGAETIVWHCPQKKNWQHKSGYDLCMKCGEKQLQFDELNGMNKIERDVRYPIRVTLQYYKSTQNGVVNKPIMNAIREMLEKSQKQADFIGSLVTDKTNYRPTEADLKTKNEVKVVHHVHNVYVPNVNKGYILIAEKLKEHCGNNWNDYLKNFKTEEVTDDDLENLSANDLAALITKMGPRNRFVKWLHTKYPPKADSGFMNGFL